MSAEKPFALAAHVQELTAENARLRERNRALAQLALARQIETQQLQERAALPVSPDAGPDAGEAAE
ncbi:hypothetical protein [Szabonella alba]|uniref:Transposase n=1 Tax=Szabonella alba TaxID=2804194 RepID=A0A8K0V988_9RHOB|nr:hypothetical protein [Szabonella alba]MBL4917994.1 hypothetical protein [Szabonella alba]